MGQIRYIKADKWRLKKPPLQYVDIFGLHDVYDKVAFRRNLILQGPPGAGKSLSVAAWCQKRDLPYIPFDCSVDIKRAQLYGARTIERNSSPFVLGSLVTAIAVANECGSAVLALEEIAALRPEQQKALNGLTDFRRSIALPEAETVFALKPGADLWVVGTMNEYGTAGSFSLNPDLMSRFGIIMLGYPTPAQEKAVLADRFAKTFVADQPLVDQILLLAEHTRQGTTEYCIGTRDVVQFLEDVANGTVPLALSLLLGKFVGSGDNDAVRKWMDSIFVEKPLFG